MSCPRAPAPFLHRVPHRSIRAGVTDHTGVHSVALGCLRSENGSQVWMCVYLLLQAPRDCDLMRKPVRVTVSSEETRGDQDKKEV